MRRPALELQIDALVLRGVSRADGQRIAQALQAELGRRLANPAWAGGLQAGAPPVLQLRLPAPSRAARPEAAGRQVAAQLARGLQRALRSGGTR